MNVRWEAIGSRIPVPFPKMFAGIISILITRGTKTITLLAKTNILTTNTTKSMRLPLVGDKTTRRKNSPMKAATTQTTSTFYLIVEATRIRRHQPIQIIINIWIPTRKHIRVLRSNNELPCFCNLDVITLADCDMTSMTTRLSTSSSWALDSITIANTIKCNSLDEEIWLSWTNISIYQLIVLRKMLKLVNCFFLLLEWAGRQIEAYVLNRLFQFRWWNEKIEEDQKWWLVHQLTATNPSYCQQAKTLSFRMLLLQPICQLRIALLSPLQKTRIILLDKSQILYYSHYQYHRPRPRLPYQKAI